MKRMSDSIIEHLSGAGVAKAVATAGGGDIGFLCSLDRKHRLKLLNALRFRNFGSDRQRFDRCLKTVQFIDQKLKLLIVHMRVYRLGANGDNGNTIARLLA